MDRRDALKALSLIAGATGFTVTPVSTHEARGVELVLLKVKGVISNVAAEHLRHAWLAGVEGTALEHTRAIVLDDHIEAEFVRTR